MANRSLETILTPPTRTRLPLVVLPREREEPAGGTRSNCHLSSLSPVVPSRLGVEVFTRPLPAVLTAVGSETEALTIEFQNPESKRYPSQ